jgi:UDP-3-O-[3-hydroxymyristoyl] glucosamine N-acyltransferase
VSTPLTAEAIALSLKPGACRIIGDPQRTIVGPAALDEARAHQLSFCTASGEEAERRIAESGAGIVLCRDEPWLTREAGSHRTLIGVSEPRLAFARALRRLFAGPRPTGIHPTAFVHPEATVADDVYIGPFVFVDRATIGSQTVIHGHCHIHAGVEIGAYVTIQAAATIGIEGFSVQRNEDGVLEWFPQLGTVVIEDDVDIGAHTNVQRGTLGETRIGLGTKIDSFVHVGHNSRIGRHVVITAQAFLGGSAIIGDGAWIGPAAVIRDGGLTIGAHALVGMGAVVAKNVEPHETVLGVPARPLGEFTQLQNRLKRLSDGD